MHADVKDLGTTSETAFLYEATKRNHIISIPFKECRYDLVLDSGDTRYRIQVKSTRSPKNKKTTRYEVNLSSGNSKLRYSKDDIDIFAVHLANEDMWYIFPLVEVPTATVSLHPHWVECPMRKYLAAWHIFEACDKKKPQSAK